jgi:hypothetical protein
MKSILYSNIHLTKTTGQVAGNSKDTANTVDTGNSAKYSATANQVTGNISMNTTD